MVTTSKLKFIQRAFSANLPHLNGQTHTLPSPGQVCCTKPRRLSLQLVSQSFSLFLFLPHTCLYPHAPESPMRQLLLLRALPLKHDPKCTLTLASVDLQLKVVLLQTRKKLESEKRERDRESELGFERINHTRFKPPPWLCRGLSFVAQGLLRLLTCASNGCSTEFSGPLLHQLNSVVAFSVSFFSWQSLASTQWPPTCNSLHMFSLSLSFLQQHPSPSSPKVCCFIERKELNERITFDCVSLASQVLCDAIWTSATAPYATTVCTITTTTTTTTILLGDACRTWSFASLSPLSHRRLLLFDNGCRPVPGARQCTAAAAAVVGRQHPTADDDTVCI